MAQISTKGAPNPLSHIFSPSSLLVGGMAVYQANQRVAKGENPFVAYAKEGALQLLYFMTSFPMAMALMNVPKIPAMTSAFLESWREKSGYIRSAQKPFSHRFEHTDATSEIMQRQLSALSDTRGGLGTEAFNMARRYGRK